jgi:hypothetical protein
VSIAKVAEVVSSFFNSSVYFSLQITKAKAQNIQLGYYKGNWATYEILKRFFKGKRYYAKCITSMDEDKNGDSEGDNKDNGDGDIG